MKRFTETLKWADPWFRRLSGEAKMLWFYLIDHCDNIGLVELDLELASADCGLKLELKHLFELGERVQEIDGGKVFLPKFIPFQYGKLSPSCPAHKRVLEAVEVHGLEKKGAVFYYPKLRVMVPKKTVQDRIGQERIGELWQIFPSTSRNRSSKAKLAKSLEDAKELPEIDDLIESAKKWAACHEWTKDGGQYAPGAHLWIKDRKWESDPAPPKNAAPIQRPLYDQPTYQKNGTNTTRPLWD